MKVRQDIFIAALLGLVLAVGGHTGPGPVQPANSGQTASAGAAVPASSPHHHKAHHRARHATKHHRRTHHHVS